MPYAEGKKTLGMCDRCGHRYLLNSLRKEWNGLMVCTDGCFEPKHPQLTPKPSFDKQAVENPRPDRDDDSAGNDVPYDPGSMF